MVIILEVVLERGNILQILHVVGVMNRGGTEAMIMNLYRCIDRSKIQFDFVVHTDKEGLYDKEILGLGGRIYHCPRYVITNHFQYVQWWKQFLSDHGSDYRIVHGHIGSTAAIYLSIAGKNGAFTIAHSHNTKGKLSPREIVYRILSYRTRFTADFFFACSPEAGRDRFGRKITEGDRFRVVRNAIDASEFRYDEAVRYTVRDELGIGKEELVIGHVGRFEEQKNHRFLIDCFSRITESRRDARLLLVGDGSLRKEIENRAEAAGLRDKVIFAGIREDVNRFLMAMDVFVFPSLYEGLGVVLIEAQASGLPCVISDTIPDEAVITDELVQKLSLKDGLQNWEKKILLAASLQRNDCTEQIVNKGYDAGSAAKWLEAFYVEKSE